MHIGIVFVRVVPLMEFLPKSDYLYQGYANSELYVSIKVMSIFTEEIN